MHTACILALSHLLSILSTLLHANHGIMAMRSIHRFSANEYTPCVHTQCMLTKG